MNNTFTTLWERLFGAIYRVDRDFLRADRVVRWFFGGLMALVGVCLTISLTSNVLWWLGGLIVIITIAVGGWYVTIGQRRVTTLLLASKQLESGLRTSFEEAWKWIQELTNDELERAVKTLPAEDKQSVENALRWISSLVASVIGIEIYLILAAPATNANTRISVILLVIAFMGFVFGSTSRTGVGTLVLTVCLVIIGGLSFFYYNSIPVGSWTPIGILKEELGVERQGATALERDTGRGLQPGVIQANPVADLSFSTGAELIGPFENDLTIDPKTGRYYWWRQVATPPNLSSEYRGGIAMAVPSWQENNQRRCADVERSADGTVRVLPPPPGVEEIRAILEVYYVETGDVRTIKSGSGGGWNPPAPGVGHYVVHYSGVGCVYIEMAPAPPGA